MGLHILPHLSSLFFVFFLSIFWFLFLLDIFIVLFCFTCFVCFCVFFVIYFILFYFLFFSFFIDVFWFFVGFIFIFLLILRLFILSYFFNFDLIFCMNFLLESDYFVGDFRLLQCNQCLFLFSLCMYKFWLSSIDVIHSFTIACLGIKCDCIPGRCVELLLFCFFSGLFYG